jgi:hypothetical protein
LFDIFKSRSSDEDKEKDNKSKKGESSNKKESSPNNDLKSAKIEINDKNPIGKAIESASIEYKKEVDDLLNKQEPGYKEKIEFSSALEYENTLFDEGLQKIKSDLVKNQVLDPAKDITPRAIEKVASITRTAERINSAPVLDVLTYLPPDGLESKKLYKEVSDDWNKKLGASEDDQNNFTNAISLLLEKFSDEGEDAIYTRTDQGLISAIAKILQGEGLKNPMIEESVKIYEERITKILEETGSEKGIESTKEEKSVAEKATEAASVNTPQTIEAVNAPVKDTESTTNTSKAEAAEDAILTSKSGASIESTKESTKESPVKAEEKSTVTVTKEEIKEVEKTGAPKATEATTETGTTKSTNDIFTGTPLEGIIGSSKEAIATVTNEPGKLEGKIDAVKEAEVKSNTTTEKTPKSITEPDKVSAIESTVTEKPIEGAEKNPLSELKLEPKSLESITGGKELTIEKGISMATEISGVAKSEKGGKIGNVIKSFFSKDKKESPVSLSEVGKMATKTETLPKDLGIKETDVQKLSSTVAAPAPVKEVKAEEAKKTEVPAPINKELVATNAQQQKIINESISKNSGDGKIVEAMDKIEKDIKHSNEELGKKMDTMIGLLSMLNDTLQSPLLVKNTSKSYE